MMKKQHLEKSGGNCMKMYTITIIINIIIGIVRGIAIIAMRLIPLV